MTKTLKSISDRPKTCKDPGWIDGLSGVLNTLRLEGSFYCRSELSAPWGMFFEEHDFASFHAIRKGSCWVTFKDGQIPLSSGDMIVFPHGDAYALVDTPGSQVLSIEEILERQSPTECGPLRYGGRGAETTLLCGKFFFEQADVHPFLSVLPTIIHIPGKDGRAVHWLESTLSIIAHESETSAQGAEAVINRATDMLIIQVIRAYLETLPSSDGSWLKGLRDHRIGVALSNIHKEPHKPWSVDELASASGMSRSSFCSLFAELVGESPHKYLTRWRIQTSLSYLRQGRYSLMEVAERVGYQTEAAFSKVFKKYIGVSPGAFKKQYTSGSLVEPQSNHMPLNDPVLQ